ncbi:MAG: FAD-binding oxidoreductase [Candidatus Vogelbacteria bacterium]|nr:FAD-binding oxidoreductase [Candidatus Vogelbacteria bacterium]
MTLKEQVLSFFSGDVFDDDETLEAFSRDSSIFRMKPKLVVLPKNVRDIKYLVKFVNEMKMRGHYISITVRGGGNDVSGAAVSESILLVTTKYLNKIIHLDDSSVHVEAGTSASHLNSVASKKGVFLPSVPEVFNNHTVGGMIANNTGSDLSGNVGKTSTYVDSLKMILSDGEECLFKSLTLAELEAKKKLQNREGEIYRKLFSIVSNHKEEIELVRPHVTRNVAGYNLLDEYDSARGVFNPAHLIAGSQGTLGIITEVTLRLNKKNEHRRFAYLEFENISKASEILESILPFIPQSFDLFDKQAVDIFVKHLRKNSKNKGESYMRNLLRCFPHFFSKTVMAGHRFIVLAEFRAKLILKAQIIAAKALSAIKDPSVKRRILDAKEVKKYKEILYDSQFLFNFYEHGSHSARIVQDTSVRTSVFEAYLKRLLPLLDSYHFRFTFGGRVGDGNLRIITLIDLSRKDEALRLRKLTSEVADLVLKFKGTLSTDINDGLLLGPMLERMYGEKVYNLFIETKKVFDPNNIFNPHKKINVTSTFALAHLEH